jgi:hypothetical protein
MRYLHLRIFSIGLCPVIDSPCNRVCTLDPASGRCMGCGRSLDEITRWTQMTDAERARIIAELGRRSVARRWHMSPVRRQGMRR